MTPAMSAMLPSCRSILIVASFSRDCGDPEANASGGMVLEVTISPSGAFMYGVAVVTTTTRGVLVAGRPSQRVNRCIVTVWTKPALTPLPDISQHVINTEGIRFFLTHGMSHTAAVGLIPSDLVKWPIGFLRAARPGRIFPLRFRRQANRPSALHRVCFCQEGLHILPTDLLDWGIRTCCQVVGWIVAHHVLPLLLSDVELAHPEVLADGDLVNGTLHLVARRARRARLPTIISMNDQIGAHTEGTSRDLNDDETRLVEIDIVGLLQGAGGERQGHEPRQSKNHQPKCRHRVLLESLYCLRRHWGTECFGFFEICSAEAVDNSHMKI